MTEPTGEQLLAFERDHTPGKHTSRKDEQIRAVLGIKPVRYYVLLGRLIWLEDALLIDPMLTNRLRRISMEANTENGRRLGIRFTTTEGKTP